MIIGIILIVILGSIAWVTCSLSSNINKYEGYERKEKEK